MRVDLADLLIGNRFGKWTVIREVDSRPSKSGQPRRYFEARCDCGTLRDVFGGSFRGCSERRRKVTRSCGCTHFRHGLSPIGKRTGAYNIWNGIVQRCTNERSRGWINYGGRGITICDRWRDFVNFLEDMGERPPGKSIDRIDNSLGYFKENCRWATQSEQCRNKRTNRPVTVRGETKLLVEWCEIYGLEFRQTHKKLFRAGISPDQVFSHT